MIRGDSVLLVRRGKEPSRGLWSIPGGLVELGEDLKEAVRREVREECGVEIEPGELLDVVNAVSKDKNGRVRFHYIIIDYLADWRTGKPNPGSDVERASWVKLSKLADLQMTESARLVVKRAAGGARN